MTKPLSFTSNLRPTNRGPTLHQGENLIIKVEGSPNATSGVLYKRHLRFFWKMIQLEITGTPKNPEKNQITFEMKIIDRRTREIAPMEVGLYKFVLRGYFGYGVKGWGPSKFKVVP